MSTDMNRIDTIAAIATPVGNGAISVVRLTGRDSLDILKKHFSGSSETFTPRKVYYGKWLNRKNTMIDEVQIIFYKAPHSYTGEDMLEIMCHGGQIVTEMILETLLDDCKPALKGEFTFRAFLNNKVDLIKAQAINDIINVKTRKGAELLVKGLEGRLSALVEQIQDEFTKISAMIEVQIDYPDEIFEHSEVDEILQALFTVRTRIESVLNGAANSIRLKDGIDTVIIGPPNAGKSTLLNTLLKEDRAIVTDTPGTTRDYIREELNVNGILLNLVDTAGIRKSNDTIETLGIERSLSMFRNAPFVMFIFDITAGIDEQSKKLIEEARLENKKILIILNKTDLSNNESDSRAVTEAIKGELKTYADVHEISALKKRGIAELENYIYDAVKGLVSVNDNDLIFNKLQKNTLEKIYGLTNSTVEDIQEGFTIDLVAIKIREIIQDLNRLTGRDYEEDLINTLFSTFCLGK
ncbi:MAG TPA: tRNA uridine-5-carboxymethylaminomethyl(34) synthesis GTPase MnmE [Thermotogota bacterium]|nr:tRNA uridine-5-carboxymethylaminomethyl(34) synthesis GTPase MnmE [Thermotogota bacterium]HPJ87862.1 tRNA uridine-5-carboxymethylaminomethyl(34) synthesis GTPase MnmE [Thermotogota bacterium]HPR94955.1 tRNA uridine-5-carboxymethylaminomethyl(34) synthesis GTPase MnmE [Thermotogota bacterium]